MFDPLGPVTDHRRTAHQYVHDALRVAILRGSLPGGTRLVQVDIARELQVSTTPVREALRSLATEGLLDLDPHRGAFVRSYDHAELVEIHELTKLLEPEAIRLAAACQDRAATLDRAERLAARMEVEADVGRWVDLNREFHEALIACIDRVRLLRILTVLRDSVAPYVGRALQDDGRRIEIANGHHRQLLALLRDGHGDRAAALASAHADLTTRGLDRFDPRWTTS